MTGLANAPDLAPPRRPGGLLRHRDFRLFWIGQTSSTFGSSVTSVALPLVAVATLDAGTFQVALLTAAAWLPWLFIGLPAGAWVDRLPRRPVMVVCDVIAALLFLSVPVAAVLGRLTIGQLLAVALLAGTVTVFFQTAYQVYLPTLLDRSEVPEGNAKLHGSASVVQVTGPGTAGLLAQLFGAVAAVLVDVASFLISAGCLLAIRAREPRRAAGRPSVSLGQQIAAGIRFTARDPYLRVLVLSGAFSNLGLMGYQSILVVFLVREVGVSPGAVGGLLALASVGGVIGAAIATPVGRRLGTARATLLLGLGTAPFALLLPLGGPGARLALVVVGAGILVAGVVAGNVIRSSFRQTYTPHHLLGRVTVSMHLLNYGTIPLGALLGGALGTTLGIRPALWITTAILPLAGALLLIGPIRQRRDLPVEPTPGPVATSRRAGPGEG